MLGLTMLDVLIGLVTIYLTFGLACTAIVEAITSWLSVRSKNLEDALRELFSGNISDSTSFVDAFFAHPVIQSLSKGADGRPSYIPKELVGTVVESLLMAGAGAKDIGSAIDALPDSPNGNRVKDILKICATTTSNNVEAFRQSVEAHFDASVSRASGWFKRYAQNVTLTVAMIMVFGANIDSLEIANSLSTNPDVRLKLVQVAEQRVTEAEQQAGAEGVDESPTALQAAQVKTAEARAALHDAQLNLNTAGLPFGWVGQPIPEGWNWLKKLIGLLISGFAISLGAPFWFDVLKKFMNVRSSAVPDSSERK